MAPTDASDRRPRPDDDQDQRRPIALLLAVKATLAACVLGIAAFNGASDAWPLVAWPMYANFRYPGPPTQLVTYDLRCTGADGRVTTLRPQDVVTFNEIIWVNRLIDQSTGSPDADTAAGSGRFLLALIEARLGEAIVRVEADRLTWSVDPAVTPPFDADRPDRREALGVVEAEPRAAPIAEPAS